MAENLHDIIPAIRMLFSQERLLTARIIPLTGTTGADICGRLLDEGYKFQKNEVLELPGNPVDNDLIRLSEMWKKSKSSYPRIVTVQNSGAFVLAESAGSADDFLMKHKINKAEYLAGRMTGRIVIVTGGAQGFGAGIAEMFFKEGANVVIADLLVPVAEKFRDELNSSNLPNKALFVRTDVSDALSVEKLVQETILYFGGLDVMISNAGILRAGGLEEMTPETFELMTKVNYAGYFNCAKYASVPMKLQSKYSAKHYSDIIQINSKSGLKGSNRNFAYAGGKFGGIGLTQSFALELMPYRIKVNSVCPGNFFDGPLWSDPENGLFVQYLRAGKVPGAKTLADVKEFYEKQVPAGRGCEVADVVKAIFYAIEQEYETGQAIPVTGGQNMLH